MAESSSRESQPLAIAPLVEAVGLQHSTLQPPLLPQIERFHQGAARLRELDLSGVEPVLVYRPKGGA